MSTPERLDELEALMPNPNWPGDGRLVLTVAEVRDLVRLIPYARRAAQLAEILEKTSTILDKTNKLLEKAPTVWVDPWGRVRR